MKKSVKKNRVKPIMGWIVKNTAFGDILGFYNTKKQAEERRIYFAENIYVEVMKVKITLL